MALDEAQQHRKHYQARLKEQEANIAQMKKRIQDLQADIEVSGVGGGGVHTALYSGTWSTTKSVGNRPESSIAFRKKAIPDMQTDAEVMGVGGGWMTKLSTVHLELDSLKVRRSAEET